MMEDISNVQRIARLAGLTEARQIDDPDEVVRREDERLAREHKIEQVIAVAFNRLNIAIAEGGVYYSDEERQAEVVLDDDSVAVDKLCGLHSSGLSDSFLIEASQDVGRGVHLIIGFRVSPTLDQVLLPRRRKLGSQST